MLWLRELVTQDGILKKEVVRNRQDANTVRMIVNPYRMYRGACRRHGSLFYSSLLLFCNNRVNFISADGNISNLLDLNVLTA